MTDRYDGQITLLDDDPAPRLRVRTPKRVAEGGAITVRATLSEPTGYDSWLGVQVVRGSGSGPRLAVGDVPGAVARGALRRGSGDRRSRCTGPASTSSTGCAPATQRDVRVPVRADRVREGTERVTFSIRFNRTKVTRTVRVVD